MDLMKLNRGNTVGLNLGYKAETNFAADYRMALLREASGRKKKNFKAGEVATFVSEAPLAPYKCTVFVDAAPELYAAGTVSLQRIWTTEDNGLVAVTVTFTADTKIDELPYLAKACAVYH